MTGRSREDLALRREALTTRASLQRIELTAAVDRVRHGSVASRGLGAMALGLARSVVRARATAAAPSGARPLLLSAGWLAVRALRASPTARWIAGAIAVGGAVWWVARSLRSGEGAGEAPDDQAPGSDESG